MRQARAEAIVCIGDPGINALAMIRSLGRRGVRVHAVALQGSAEFASASRYCASVSRPRDLDSLCDALLELKVASAERALLFIDNDRMMRALQPRVTELRRRFRIVGPVGDAERLMDKSFQVAAAAKAGIDVPRTWFPRDWSELAAIAGQTGRRLIAKPSPSRFAPGTPPPFKALVAEDSAQLAAQLRRCGANPQDILVQEYIAGDDSHVYGVLAYRAINSGALLALGIRKHRQTVPGAGIMAVGQVLDVPELRELTARLMQQLDYRGTLHAEFKRCPVDGKYYFIEWNNRPGYFHSLGWQAGFDAAWFAYCDLVQPQQMASMSLRHDARHYWISFHGDLGHLLKRPALLFRPSTWAPYFSRPEWAVYARDDVRPWLRASHELMDWLLQLPLRAARRIIRSLSAFLHQPSRQSRRAA
jgi:predicted ATP-grasp superfamily ATP-dependent carboligase